MNSLKKTDQLLFAALRTTLWSEELPAEAFAALTAEEWRTLYRTAAEQGVLALAYDAVAQLPTELQPPRALRLQWAIATEKIELRNKEQFKHASELAALYAEHQIPTFVLKGVAVGTYYPNPLHRECGDLDCFLGGHYEKGNQLAEEAGAVVERGYYKHSHIHFRSLMVENHQFCTTIRGSKQRKVLERHLQQLLQQSSNKFIGESALQLPSPDFNALFLTAHSFTHFLSEGIRLRHLCDWALLLHNAHDEIDWEKFYHHTDQLRYTRFVNTLNALAIDCLGLEATAVRGIERRYSNRVLNDIFHTETAIFSKRMGGVSKRLQLVRNRLRSVWKYHQIYQRSMIIDLLQVVTAFIFERKPRI